MRKLLALGILAFLALVALSWAAESEGAPVPAGTTAPGVLGAR